MDKNNKTKKKLFKGACRGGKGYFKYLLSILNLKAMIFE